MTRDELKSWRTRMALTNAQAAEVLALSLEGFYGQLYGRRPISAQSERITVLYELLPPKLRDVKPKEQTNGPV